MTYGKSSWKGCMLEKDQSTENAHFGKCTEVDCQTISLSTCASFFFFFPSSMYFFFKFKLWESLKLKSGLSAAYMCGLTNSLTNSISNWIVLQTVLLECVLIPVFYWLNSFPQFEYLFSLSGDSSSCFWSGLWFILSHIRLSFLWTVFLQYIWPS